MRLATLVLFPVLAACLPAELKVDRQMLSDRDENVDAFDKSRHWKRDEQDQNADEHVQDVDRFDRYVGWKWTRDEQGQNADEQVQDVDRFDRYVGWKWTRDEQAMDETTTPMAPN